jgi:hypothetical protein
VGVVHLLVQFPFGLLPVVDSSMQPQQLRCSRRSRLKKAAVILSWIMCSNWIKLKELLLLQVSTMYCTMEDLASKLGFMWYSKILSIEDIIVDWNIFCLNRISSYTGFTLGKLSDGEDSVPYL